MLGTQGFSHPDSPFVEVHLCGTRNLLHFFLPNFQRFPVSTGPVCGGSTVVNFDLYFAIFNLLRIRFRHFRREI